MLITSGLGMKRTSEIAALVVCGIFSLLPLVGNFANRGIVVVLTLIVLLPVIQDFKNIKQRIVSSISTREFVLFTFIAYAGASAFWSIDPVLTAQKALAILGTVLLFLLGRQFVATVEPTYAQRVLYVLSLGIAVLAVLVVIFFIVKHTLYLDATGAITTSYLWLKSEASKTGASILALLIWPLAMSYILGQRSKIVLLGFVSTLIVVVSANSTSVQLALISGLAALVVAFVLRSRAALIVMKLGLLLCFVLIPYGASQIDYRNFGSKSRPALLDSLPESALHRLVIYGFTAEKIKERPVFGWGFESSRVIPGGQDQVILYDVDGPPGPDGKPVTLDFMTLMPLHPHSFILQWWMELGAFGMVIGFAFLVLVLRDIGAWPGSEPTKAFMFAQFISWLVIASLSYGAWQSWWLASTILAYVTMRVAVTTMRPIPRTTAPRVENDNG